MTEKDDWRLTGQEDYLQGVTLKWKRYTAYSETWEHDHCAFCWQKFMDIDDVDIEREGYTTEDDYYWVCKQCYEDFKDMFMWRVIDGV